MAGPREQAKRIHDRLAGVPPTAAVLDQMVNEIANNNDPMAAAMIAIENPNFYNVTLKNWVTPWTNEEQTVFAPLNDYTATVIGMIRDDKDFRKVLYDDILYLVPAEYTGPHANELPAISNENNDRYEAIERLGLNLMDKTVLQERKQTEIYHPNEGEIAPAGIITTRAAARAFFIDGTNRAMFRFTMLNHLCRDLELIKDPTRPSDRVRQDASRSPGGDSRVYFNNCLGCHAGMEPLAEAYAYYDYVYPEGDEEAGHLVYTPGVVQPKYLINSSNFKDGYATFDDSWINYWRKGPNSQLGWDTSLPDHGNGAKSMGEELANSEAFAECQVTKAFQAVCLRAPGNQNDRDQITAMTHSFETGYNMKNVFAEAAVYCMGD